MKKQYLTLSAMLMLFSSWCFASPFDMPRGNYRESCVGCSSFGNIVRCVCKDRRGRLNRTQLDVPSQCRFVENINGRLTCTEFRRGNDRWRDGDRDGRGNDRDSRRGRRVEDFPAGQIWGQGQARVKCPAVCSNNNREWTGGWRTIRGGSVSVCACRR